MNPFGGKFPDLQHMLRLAYSVYRRFKSRFLTWAVAGWKYDAPIHPFQLYWVNPSDIKYIQDRSGEVNDYPYYVSEVKGGSWDELVIPVDEHDFFESFELHFNNEINWQETPWVNRAISEIEEDGLVLYGCESEEEFQKRLADIDQLYNAIRKYGYKTQRELIRTDDDLRHDWARFCPELHEIVVNIGRDGRFIFEDGWHRFAIARVLDLSEVPIRINIRHNKWQSYRFDGITRSTDELDIDHPDL